MVNPKLWEKKAQGAQGAQAYRQAEIASGEAMTEEERERLHDLADQALRYQEGCLELDRELAEVLGLGKVRPFSRDSAAGLWLWGHVRSQLWDVTIKDAVGDEPPYRVILSKPHRVAQAVGETWMAALAQAVLIAEVNGQADS